MPSFSDPIIKKIHASSYTAGRTSGNPLFGSAFSATVDAPIRRVYLLIQNVGATDVDITFTGGGAIALKLFAGTTISLDHVNSGFTASDEVRVFEAFA